jgi:magnesium transporter
MIWSLSYSGKKVKKTADSIKMGDRTWIDVSGGSDKDFEKISKLTGVHVSDMKSVLDQNALPKVVNRKGYTMVVLRALSSRQYFPFGIFISNKFMVTVHKKKVYAINDLSKLVSEREGKEFFSKGVAYLFYKLSYHVTTRLHRELDKLEDEMDDLEDKILDGKVNSPSGIFSLKQIVMNIRRALKTNKDSIDLIFNGRSRYVPKSGLAWFSELRVEMEQVVSIAEMLRERLTGAMDMYMSSVSNKLNDIMRGFTVIASLLLLPMLISGIWGMNFAKIPFFDNPYGFFVPLLIMLFSVFLMVLWFRRKKWM